MVGYQLKTPGDLLTVVSRDQIKDHVRIASTIDDTLLDVYIKAAVAHAQRLTKLSLVNETWIKSIDCIPESRIVELERSPLKSVTQIEYHDGDAYQTFSSDNYHIDLISRPGRIYFDDLPSGIRLLGVSNVKIEFVSGITNLPDDLLHAIQMFVAGYHCKRLDGGKKSGSYYSDAQRYLNAAENICYLHSSYAI